MKNNRVVKIHCGSAFVRGKARRYPYFVASLFVKQQNKDGSWRWVNSGCTTTPRRSIRVTWEDAQRLAKRRGATFMGGYGSLHNKKTEPPVAPKKRVINFGKILNQSELVGST